MQGLLIYEIDGSKCKLTALIDIGSPVSFLRLDVYNQFVKSGKEELIKSSRRLSNISGDPLEVIGVAEIELKFIPLQEIKINLELFVLRDSLEAIILGRDFFTKHKLTFVYSPSRRGRAL